MKKKIFGIALLGVLLTGCSNGNNSVQNNAMQNNLNIKNEKKTTTFMDSATGLMWQDDFAVQRTYKNWKEAKEYCENLTLEEYSDWRLPNIYELTTLLDNRKSNLPYIIDGFNNITSDFYWSSTFDIVYAGGAWGVYFSNGYNSLKDKISSNYVRCVRAGELNFDNLVILKNQGKVKINQENIDKISPLEKAKIIKEMDIVNKKVLAYQQDKSAYDVASSINTINSYKEYLKNYPNGNYAQSARSNMEYLSPEKVAQRKREQAERERQAEYDRKHACDGFYSGKNFKVHTTGLFGGDEKARITGVDKESGQVSFEWYDGGLREWRSEETNCSYLKTQMR